MPYTDMTILYFIVIDTIQEPILHQHIIIPTVSYKVTDNKLYYIGISYYVRLHFHT